ncbi:Vegetative incompatibility protein HET-E-1 [Trametes pubescens]|uniref:Vegetative incompatibility protein HET-E-1 n=1 Tax=Trametes pubescens TaxID=154538 RepID=A0A1M2VGY6_TRAPU|nr:Vegetative incompatibility protein HET-E-1 [Trametes pubescens]
MLSFVYSSGRLVHAQRAFRWFDEPGDVSYAAVSCVWAEDEQSYQDLLDIQPSTSTENTCLTDPRLSSTIRHACTIAADAGYQYIWIPNCSINRTDSTELSAALNALWEWYARASVCFAYLADVGPNDTPRRPDSQFRKSSWHTDARTLQPLIASQNLVFLATAWSVLGTKMTLSSTIENVTGVDRTVLRGDVGVRDVSVARRMWWASKRHAQVEDAAYALLGLFEVRASATWGAEPQAFTRLQEEVARTIPDQSIFAWHYHLGHEHPDGVFALGPCCFARSGGVSPIPPDDLAARLGLSEEELVPCLPRALSPSALTMRLPLIPHHIETYPPTTAFYEVFGVAARFSHAAVLQCEDEHGRLLVLTLDRPPGSSKEYVVKAVETPLGRRDRVWSCPNPLAVYRDVAVVADVEILRGPLHTPWVQPAPGGRTPPTSVILDPACRAALEEQGYDVAYETLSQALVDDLYKRARGARILADVHRFVLSLRPVEDALRAGRISIEVVARRHSLAPIPDERIAVRWEDAEGEHAAVRVEDWRGGDTAPAGVRYVVGSQPGFAQVLCLHLSRPPYGDDVHLLRLELEELAGRSKPSTNSQAPIDEEAREETERSSALPRLPSIRGWASRRGGRGGSGKKAIVT